MLQPLGLGTRSRVVVLTLVTSFVAAAVLIGVGLAMGFDGLGITVGMVAAGMVAILVAGLWARWVFAPLRALDGARAAHLGGQAHTPEAIVARLARAVEEHDKELEDARHEGQRAVAELETALAGGRARAEGLTQEIAALTARADRIAGVVELHELVLEPVLGQLGRAIERVINIDSMVHAARPLLRVARAAVLWAEEAVATLQRVDVPLGPTKEPFSLRDEIGAVCRAMSLGLGREVSMRFVGDFPQLATTDRTRLRLATLACAHWVARHDADGELVLEAGFSDGAAGRPSHLHVTIDSRGIQPLPTPDTEPPAPRASALAELVRPVGGDLLVSSDPHRIGFTLEAARNKRTSGHTLFGVGALSDRGVLVIDPRPRGRALLCEQLVAWRMTPTAAADVPAALEALELAERAKKPFEAIIVCPRVPGMRSDGTPPELGEMARHTVFRKKRILSLESFDTLTTNLHEAIAALEPQRMARPAPPLELLEALTLMLAPRPGSRQPQDGKARAQGALSVLVVEDNAINQALLAKMLERRGHQATLTANGADAVDRVQEAPGGYDAVLMDIQMPVMDGYEATAVIRMREAQGNLRRIPIIAVTAHAMSGEREKCLEAGMDGYLSKPVSEAELMALIDETVRRVSSGASGNNGAPPTSDVFDARRVLEFAAGDQAFLRTLVEIFGETTPKQVGAIESAVLAQDAGALMRAAHQLKGSVGNFAAERARRLAADLEDHARKKDFATAAATLAPLRAELEALREGLQRLV